MILVTFNPDQHNETVYVDTIRGCGYHHDSKNWDFEKKEFIDNGDDAGKGCYTTKNYSKS